MTQEIICFTIKVYTPKIKGEHKTLETLQLNKSFSSEKEFIEWCRDTEKQCKEYFNLDVICDFYTKRK